MSFETRERLRYVRPFSEPPAPPGVVLGNRMELGQVISNQAHRGRRETRELLLIPIVGAAAMVNRELGQKAHRADGLVPVHLVPTAVRDDHLTGQRLQLHLAMPGTQTANIVCQKSNPNLRQLALSRRNSTRARARLVHDEY
jgi:hypothetical protein